MYESDSRDFELAEELLGRALLDNSTVTSLGMQVDGLNLSDSVTVIFHGRRDLGLVQTYITLGLHSPGSEVSASDLMRLPCDLDLSAAESLDQAQELYGQQAQLLSDTLISADTVLSVWLKPLSEFVGSEVAVRRSSQLGITLPAYRILPVALIAEDRELVVVAVCTERSLAQGRPPLGIACVQKDVMHIYPLPDDPESCLNDFFVQVSERARLLSASINQQELSAKRFFEIADSSEQ